MTGKEEDKIYRKLKLNEGLYSFNKDNEFYNEKKKKDKKNSRTLNAFLGFSLNEDQTMLTGIPLKVLLKNWGENLKCRNIVMNQKYNKSDNYLLYLVALRKEKDKQNERKENEKKVKKPSSNFMCPFSIRSPMKNLLKPVSKTIQHFIFKYITTQKRNLQTVLSLQSHFYMMKKEKIYLSAS